MESLAWHPACHKLFLLYRDTLRVVWRPDSASPGPSWLYGFSHEFLLGLTDYNEEAKGGGLRFLTPWPAALERAWGDILGGFPTAAVEGRVEISMLWGVGDLSLVPQNDFQRAFYLLFRQSWRARVCPRCNMFFVARRPRQIFCGTVCSAGNRLASKRKWWNRAGAKRRARQRQRVTKGSRRERKSR